MLPPLPHSRTADDSWMLPPLLEPAIGHAVQASCTWRSQAWARRMAGAAGPSCWFPSCSTDTSVANHPPLAAPPSAWCQGEALQEHVVTPHCASAQAGPRRAARARTQVLLQPPGVQQERTPPKLELFQPKRAPKLELLQPVVLPARRDHRRRQNLHPRRLVLHRCSGPIRPMHLDASGRHRRTASSRVGHRSRRLHPVGGRGLLRRRGSLPRPRHLPRRRGTARPLLLRPSPPSWTSLARCCAPRLVKEGWRGAGGAPCCGSGGEGLWHHHHARSNSTRQADVLGAEWVTSSESVAESFHCGRPQRATPCRPAQRAAVGSWRLGPRRLRGASLGRPLV